MTCPNGAWWEEIKAKGAVAGEVMNYVNALEAQYKGKDDEEARKHLLVAQAIRRRRQRFPNAEKMTARGIYMELVDMLDEILRQENPYAPPSRRLPPELARDATILQGLITAYGRWERETSAEELKALWNMEKASKKDEQGRTTDGRPLRPYRQAQAGRIKWASGDVPYILDRDVALPEFVEIDEVIPDDAPLPETIEAKPTYAQVRARRYRDNSALTLRFNYVGEDAEGNVYAVYSDGERDGSYAYSKAVIEKKDWWRFKEPTQRQSAFLRNLGHEGEIPATRGAASSLIDELKAKRDREREYENALGECHYCGLPAYGYGFFGELACPDCGGPPPRRR